MAFNTAYLDELVAEYLTYRGFFSSLKAFKQDQKSDKSKSFNVDKIVDFLLQMTTSGDLQLLKSTWSHLNAAIFSRLPDTVHGSAAQRLEAALYKLYLVHAFQNGKKEKIQEFFQTMNATLIGNSDNSVWKDWLAFPYVSQPSSQAPFAICFTRPWQDSVAVSLTNLLMMAFHLLPKPRLVILIEHITKLEADISRSKDGSRDVTDNGTEKGRTSVIESLLPSNNSESLTSRPSRRLLSFFLSNKNSSPASNPSPQTTSQSSDFRRSKSQSSFPRQQPSLLANSGLSDIPTPENPEADASRMLGVESETEDTVVIKRMSKVSLVEPDTSDVSAPEDAFNGGDGEDDDDDVNEDDLSSTPKPDNGTISQSLPAQSFVEKVIDSFQSMTPGKNSENRRTSHGLISNHRKQGSTTKFTCLDTERAEVPGCHGAALIRYSADGRFLGVLSQSAHAVFIFSADAINSRGVVSSALVSSSPSCFCIGSSSRRSAEDDVTQLLVAVGCGTAGKLYVFGHTDSAIKTSKMTMTSTQVLLVPLEPGSSSRLHSVVSVEVVPSQLDIAITLVCTSDNQSKQISAFVASQIYAVSLVDQVVIRRMEFSFGNPLSCCCCCSSLGSNSILQSVNRQNSCLLICGDHSGSVFASAFSYGASGSNQVVSWSNTKLSAFSKIICVQQLSDSTSPTASPSSPSSAKLIIGDVTGRFAVCRIDQSSDASLNISVLTECDAFCGGFAVAPSASPDGQYAAVLFDSGSSLFLVNISSTEFGDIVAKLPDGAERDAKQQKNGTGSKESDLACVAWTPSLLQTAFTYVAALTKSGDLLVFRLLT